MLINILSLITKQRLEENEKWTKLETSHVAYVASYRYSNAQKE